MSPRALGFAVTVGCAALALTGCTTPLLGASTAPTPAAATVAPTSTSSRVQVHQAAAPRVAAAQVAPGAWAPTPTYSSGFLVPSPLPTSTPAKIAAPTLSPSCGWTLGQATTIGVAAIPGTRRANVQWHDTSDPNVLMYRIAAIPQGSTIPTPRPSSTPVVPALVPQWQSVATAHTCQSRTLTVTGLTSGATYEFWLDVVHTSTTYEIAPVTRESMIGRSPAITIR